MSKIWQCHRRFQTVLENWSKLTFETKMAYDQCIREVEHWCFPTLVLSSSGGMGPTAKAVYTKLASMVATKHKQSYKQSASWLQCRLSFSLLHSSIMWLRGACSSAGNPQLTEAAIDQAICDGRVALSKLWTWHELTRTYKISYSITLCFLSYFISL